MSEEELIETLRTFEKNRVEQLEEPARNLFYAIMKIANERDRLNNIINKTIESLQKHYDNSYSTDDVNDIGVGTYDDLMEILKGSDKE
jgi:hypothetical protein